MREWAALLLVLVGTGFMLIAAVGVVRFPDVFTRMQAAAKAGTLGVGFVMIGVAIWFWEPAAVGHALLIIVFFVLTVPVAAHVIALASYRLNVPLWSGTHRDELSDALRGGEWKDWLGESPERPEASREPEP